VTASTGSLRRTTCLLYSSVATVVIAAIVVFVAATAMVVPHGAACWAAYRANRWVARRLLDAETDFNSWSVVDARCLRLDCGIGRPNDAENALVVRPPNEVCCEGPSSLNCRSTVRLCFDVVLCSCSPLLRLSSGWYSHSTTPRAASCPTHRNAPPKVRAGRSSSPLSHLLHWRSWPQKSSPIETGHT
jgi:hypothetical protein